MPIRRRLPLAVAAMQACEFVGLPECQLTLAQAVAYLACAPKSNAATVAIGEARHDVREGRLVPVPRHLRDRHYPRRQAAGPRRGLSIRPQQPEGGVAAQDYLGVDREYYRPVDRGFERELAERLAKIRALLRAEPATDRPSRGKAGGIASRGRQIRPRERWAKRAMACEPLVRPLDWPLAGAAGGSLNCGSSRRLCERLDRTSLARQLL